MTKTKTRDQALLEIARRRINSVNTLETAGSDEKDFHSVAVWSLKKVLEEACQAGLEAGRRGE